MNNTTILVAVQAAHYAKLESLLEDRYVISANQGSQELVLDAIPKFKPTVIIIDAELRGTRDIRDFYSVLCTNYPDVLIMFYQSETIESRIQNLDGYIKGELELPPPFITAVQEDIPVEPQPAEEGEAEEDESQKKSKRISLRNLLDKTFHGGKTGNGYTVDQLMMDDDDWTHTAESTVDIYNYLRKIVVITGASGGVGKTDTAINLATYAAANGFKTVLCGFNLQNDDVASRLGLEYRRGRKLMTAFELYQAKKLTISSLQDCLQDYRGLKVLVGIEKPEERQDMDMEFFKEVSKILKANFDLVILDTENNSYSPAYFSVIELADHILVPCTTHNSVLEQLRDELHSWKDDFDIPLSKVDVIFNKANEGGFVTKDHIEKYTTREVIAVIPHSKEVFRGSEREEPAVLRHSFEANKIRKEYNKILFRLTGRKIKKSDTIKPKITLLKRKVKGIAQGKAAN